jgi:hypothetical protein
MPADPTKFRLTPWTIVSAMAGLLIAAGPGSASAQTVRPEALQLPAARTLAREALAPGTRENPQTEDVIVVVDSTGHSWLACGTQAQMHAQQEAHQAHGHNHDFYGPCPGQGLVSGDDTASAGAAGSGSAAPGSNEMAETDANTDNCATASPGSTATNCQTAPALAGQQIRQQLHTHLPRVTRQLPRAADEDDDN